MAIMNLQLAISDSGAIINNGPLPTITVDQIHLGQVFQNLIANAIKYRKPAEIPRIYISAERQPNQWLFTVKDNGLGFDTHYAEQIFGLFKRLHGKDYPGTGIGLSLCKKIVEREGGRIWAKSEVGVGSTFFFTIPDKSFEG